MIDHEDEKYDHSDHLFSDIVKRNSSCYSPSEFEKKNMRLIEKFLQENKYESKHSVEVHIEYIEHLLNKLQNARKEEISVCPSNAELNSEINKVQQLARMLTGKLSSF